MGQTDQSVAEFIATFGAIYGQDISPEEFFRYCDRFGQAATNWSNGGSDATAELKQIHGLAEQMATVIIEQGYKDFAEIARPRSPYRKWLRRLCFMSRYYDNEQLYSTRPKVFADLLRTEAYFCEAAVQERRLIYDTLQWADLCSAERLTERFNELELFKLPAELEAHAQHKAIYAMWWSWEFKDRLFLRAAGELHDISQTDAQWALSLLHDEFG